MTNSDRFERYLTCYASKDIDSISEMFAEDVMLRDWKVFVSGKLNALVETKKNFANAGPIEIDILTRLESTDSIAGELKITVDGSEVLFVVDVIKFDSSGLISSIQAYIGRGNSCDGIDACDSILEK